MVLKHKNSLWLYRKCKTFGTVYAACKWFKTLKIICCLTEMLLGFNQKKSFSQVAGMMSPIISRWLICWLVFVSRVKHGEQLFISFNPSLPKSLRLASTVRLFLTSIISNNTIWTPFLVQFILENVINLASCESGLFELRTALLTGLSVGLL